LFVHDTRVLRRFGSSDDESTRSNGKVYSRRYIIWRWLVDPRAGFTKLISLAPLLASQFLFSSASVRPPSSIMQARSSKRS